MLCSEREGLTIGRFHFQVYLYIVNDFESSPTNDLSDSKNLEICDLFLGTDITHLVIGVL